MAKQIFMAILCTSVLLCTTAVYSFSAEHSLEGFWFCSQEAFLEFRDNKIIITASDKADQEFYLGYEAIDESRFQIKEWPVADVSPIMTVDWQAKSFSISDASWKRKDITCSQAPNVAPSEIIGTWYTHEINDGIESSEIVIQRESSYDFDSLKIDHGQKTYTRYIEKDVKTNFKNGFIFTDVASEDGEKYVYYINSYSNTMMKLADLEGYEWTQLRKNDAVHMAIPEGYSENKTKLDASE